MAKAKEKEAKVKDVEEIEEEIDDEYEDLSLEERVINIEKKVNYTFGLSILITILLVLVLIFSLNSGSNTYSSSSESENESTETASSDEYDVSDFTEITAQDIEKTSKGKTILIYIGRSSCGYCLQYLSTLKEVQKEYGYTTYYIDIAKILDYEKGGILDEEANTIMTGLKTTDDQEDVMDDWGSTPMTLIIKNNKIIDSMVGAGDTSALETLVKNNGLAS